MLRLEIDKFCESFSKIIVKQKVLIFFLEVFKCDFELFTSIFLKIGILKQAFVILERNRTQQFPNR